MDARGHPHALDPELARLLAEVELRAGQLSRRHPDRVALARALTRWLMRTCAPRVPSPVGVELLSIRTGCGDVPLRLYRPGAKPAGRPVPLVLFFHGGGWMAGSAEDYDPFVRTLCALTQLPFASVDYRLAPENPFPAAHQDCLRAAEWVFAHAHEIGVQREAVMVMGDSAGAALAAATAWRLARRGRGRFRRAYLLYPFLDLRGDHGRHPSRLAYGDGRFLISVDDLAHSADTYLRRAGRAEQAIVSPLLLPELSLLPPTTLIIAGFDPLADEAKAFASRLVDAGVETTGKLFPTAIHGFLPFGDLAIARVGRAWLAGRVRGDLAADECGDGASRSEEAGVPP
ncbi:MAG: acetylhydrolase [Rhodothalassiaceae bacterium]|nr:MAG: acetylhydrolase [Rhodothalassiaceae bacterium]